MRTTSLMLAALCPVLLTACKKEEPCETLIPEWCHVADLSSEYKPVCGCDGKTYQNAAYALCVGGVSYREGKCR